MFYFELFIDTEEINVMIEMDFSSLMLGFLNCQKRAGKIIS